MISSLFALLLAVPVVELGEPAVFECVNDLPAPSTAPADELVRYEQLSVICEERAEMAQEAASWEETYWEPTYYEPAYSAPSDGLNSFTGVNCHEGRTETYYSSNVLYHYRTPEWTLDDEGFYRTAEGYYVVAASDMEQGTTFEGSKGTCIVLDCGCADGVTDYYVGW